MCADTSPRLPGTSWVTADGARTYEETAGESDRRYRVYPARPPSSSKNQTIDAAETALRIVHPSLEAIAADKDKSLEVAMNLAS